MEKKYGYLKHLKSGQFIKLTLDLDVHYASVEKDYHEVSIFEFTDAMYHLYDGRYIFKETYFKHDAFDFPLQLDISNDEILFIECEIILKDY